LLELLPRSWSAARAAALRLGLVVVGLAALVLIFERRFIYFPDRGQGPTPAQLGLAAEELRLTAEDGVALHGYFLRARDERLTVLFNHGNAGNIGDRLDRAMLLQSRLGWSVLLYDYRGYGRSEGTPDEEGTYRDARAAYRYLVEVRKVEPGRLVIMGESLGSAVALDLALRRPAQALILEAPFTSVPDMARTTALFPLAGLVRTRYDNLAKVAGLRCPLLVVHGERDEIVPFAQGRRLFEAAPDPKSFYAVPGAHHNDVYVVGAEAYWRALADFVARPPQAKPNA
jgi:fermentation-respiration switch protein FrsA (DUF1100 family)